MPPGTRRRLAAVAAVSLLFLLLLPVATAQVTEDRPHATVYTVDVHEDGNATWTVELRYRLIGQSEIGSFEGVREDFEEGNLTVFEGIEDEMRPFAEEVSDQTGRPMALSGFERDVRLRETLTLTEGVVSVSFVWSNFAATNGSVVRFGDVFEGGGLALAGDERLVVEGPGSVPVSSASPEPDTEEDSRLIWDGERFFEAEQPRILFGEVDTPDENGSDGGRGGGGDGNVSGNGEETDGTPTAAAVVAGLLVLVSGVAGGFYLSRSIMGGDESTAIEVDGPDDAETDDLLTDEDRVVRILERNDGKMKQAEIVDRTDWSKSKVSMLLSDMEDDGTVSKLRLGRENVIELEDDEGE